jgi:type IV pilus assembly protein PilZ
MADNSQSDRRDASRAPIELKVEYRRLNGFFADYTRNISKGGTFIKTQRPLDLGTEFIFALVVPTFDQPLRLRGTVQWIVSQEQATEDSPAGMGIRFLYASDQERHGVESLVEQLMIAELGESLSGRLLGRPPRG